MASSLWSGLEDRGAADGAGSVAGKQPEEAIEIVDDSCLIPRRPM
ncbi:MAG TPA: hypothetical protein VGG72_04765 [Bryobacteraceae bacterium]